MNVLAYFSYLTLKIISKEMFLTREGEVQKLEKKKKLEKYSGFNGIHTRASRIISPDNRWALLLNYTV